MAMIEDWIEKAANEIAEGMPGLAWEELRGALRGACIYTIRKHCPFTAGVAYVPLGEADSDGDFESVGAFHAKFGLPTSADGPPRELSEHELGFRLRFMLEELTEFCEAHWIKLDYTIEAIGIGMPQDLPKAFDALVDLAYVVLGTAHMHRFPWNDGFARVQRANITKERCGIDHKFYRENDGDQDLCDICGKHKVTHSVRGSALDVIKPAGWAPPNMVESLMAAGWRGPALPMGEPPQ